MDKDAYLTKLAKSYMAIMGDGRTGVFCEDSLAEPGGWSLKTQQCVELGTFDVVVTNPPFGSKIKVTGERKLSQYDLAKRWKRDRSDDDWESEAAVRTDQSPQILFIERCIQLLKPGGRLGIILPESIFGMTNYGYVVSHLLKKYTLRGFVSLPEEVFQPYTHAKTCVVFLQNDPPPGDESYEMAIADWFGHDSRGNVTVRRSADGSEEILDDIPKIAESLHGRIRW